MDQLQIESYEIKMARTEHPIPVINGVHLHSIYNPLKEAESMLEKYLSSLKSRKEVLVLGLGFGYHINEMINLMTSIHGDQFKIVVIEPNAIVYKECIDRGLVNNKNILIYYGQSADELYADHQLVHFLLKKPTVIAHPPSFNLYQKYFKEFLTFEAPLSIKDSLNFISRKSVYDYLLTFNPTSTFDSILDTLVPEKNQLTDMDFAVMALSEMTRASRQLSLKKGDLVS